MAHQLRRILAVNIRTPQGGTPSSRISELDPRGGVLAIGNNGVGKTTFLRLIPLFFGAKPQQILRGTGRSTLVNFSLPDPSSAVAYEYERESETDLRCVAMFAKPGADAPQFFIVSSGYREEFFYDSANEQFVTRDEFKPRVEAMGYQVSHKLELHQYRAVILNERVLTKEGTDLRRLAALHSLGPKALYGLDQLAASMATERVSIRDLRNIVIDRITDSQSNDGGAEHHLKLDRGKITTWLDARDHLAAVMARISDVKEIRDCEQKIRVLDLELNGMHVAVKGALRELVLSNEQLKEREEVSQLRFSAKTDELKTALAAAEEAKTSADVDFGALKTELNGADMRAKHFSEIQAEQLLDAEAGEEGLKTKRSALEKEKADLEEASGNLAKAANGKRGEFNTKAAEESSAIGKRLLQENRDSKDALEKIRSTEAESIAALKESPRIAHIVSEKLGIASRLGALKVVIAHPFASDDALSQKVLADKEVLRMAGELRSVGQKVKAANEAAAECRGRSDKAIVGLSSARRLQEELARRVAAAEEELKPPSGSLLEFMRRQEPEMLTLVAKSIDPALLMRTDLSPELSGIESSPRLPVGPFSFDLAPVQKPGWVSMSSLRETIDALKTEMAAASDSVKTSETAAADVATELRNTIKAAAQQEASESVLTEANNKALATQKQLEIRIDKEKQESLEQHKEEEKELLSRVLELDAESAALKALDEKARSNIEKDFARQRQEHADRWKQTEDRAKREQEEIEARLRGQLESLERDLARELEGLGIDPARIPALNTQIRDLGLLLNNISKNRHEVASWKEFRDGVLPSLQAKREGLKSREAVAIAAATKLKELQALETSLGNEIREESSQIANARATNDGRKIQLDGLAESLRDFVRNIASAGGRSWTIADLVKEVPASRTALSREVESLNTKNRVLRNAMIVRSGPITDWLVHKEAQMPDRQMVLEHEYAVDQASILCQWFDGAEHGPYIDQIHKEMQAFLGQSSQFVRVMDLFDRRVRAFNADLQAALSQTAKFERFRDLSVTVSSGISQLEYMRVLQQMKDMASEINSTLATFVAQRTELPTNEQARLIRSFRDIMQTEGGLKVNLADQVRLECSLTENDEKRVISTEEEFKAVSSNGNSALITAMFLMGFLEMTRGKDSPVRMTWVSDEVGRFDPGNLGAFLETLSLHKIDVISASPSLDPALGRFFPRICVFEPTGEVATSATSEVDGVAYADY